MSVNRARLLYIRTEDTPFGKSMIHLFGLIYVVNAHSQRKMQCKGKRRLSNCPVPRRN